MNKDDPANIWDAKAGFGGTEYLLAGLFSEGVVNRGVLEPQDVARLVCGNPARRFGLGGHKGEIAVGYDADVALFDPGREWTITASDSFSTQTYTPFEGIQCTGQVQHTFLRGNRVYSANDNAEGGLTGDIVGAPSGKNLVRPYRGD